METTLGIIAGCLATLRSLFCLRARHQQLDDLMSDVTPRIEPHQEQYGLRTMRASYPNPESPTPENELSGVGPTGLVGDVVHNRPSSFKSNHLERMSRTRTWVTTSSMGDGTVDNPSATSVSAQPSGARPRTSTEIAGGIQSGTGWAISSGSSAVGSLGGEEHVVTIDGSMNLDYPIHQR